MYLDDGGDDNDDTNKKQRGENLGKLKLQIVEKKGHEFFFHFWSSFFLSLQYHQSLSSLTTKKRERSSSISLEII